MAGITTEYRVNAGYIRVFPDGLHISRCEEINEYYVSDKRTYSMGHTLIHVEGGASKDLAEFLRSYLDWGIPINMILVDEAILVTCRQWTIKDRERVSAEFVRVIEV